MKLLPQIKRLKKLYESETITDEYAREQLQPLLDNRLDEVCMELGFDGCTPDDQKVERRNLQKKDGWKTLLTSIDHSLLQTAREKLKERKTQTDLKKALQFLASTHVVDARNIVQIEALTRLLEHTGFDFVNFGDLGGFSREALHLFLTGIHPKKGTVITGRLIQRLPSVFTRAYGINNTEFQRGLKKGHPSPSQNGRPKPQRGLEICIVHQTLRNQCRGTYLFYPQPRNPDLTITIPIPNKTDPNNAPL
jgi:hypothetical protein